MKIEKIVDRELTAGELESMERFRSYTDGVSFACLRERVMVMLSDEPSKDVQKHVENARKRMKQALSEHPDFTVYEMDDGNTLLCLNSGIFAFSDEDTMFLEFSLRGRCLEAAEAMEILAVAYEEE